jgi:hypothetical protein
MHRLLESQQSFRKGKLSCPTDGATPTNHVGLGNFLPSRWFLRIQPSVGFIGRPIKKYLPDQMGNLRL